MIKKPLEKFGIFLNNGRNLALVLFLGLLPILAAVCFIYRRSMELQQTKDHFLYVQEKAVKTSQERLMKKQFFEKYSHCDPYFIPNHLESFVFLEDEFNELNTLKEHTLFCNDSSLVERMKFLKQNSLAFREENNRNSDLLKEAEHPLLRPVETTMEDLFRFLSIVENVTIGTHVPAKESPQLLFTDFQLTKAKKNYSLNCSLLKREFSEKGVK